jgi:hypothetical protein
VERRRISRRALLRNIGLAGAAAWVAPVLTSTRASASMDRCRRSKSEQLCRGDIGWCEDPHTCGTCGTLGAICLPEIGTGTLLLHHLRVLRADPPVRHHVGLSEAQRLHRPEWMHGV